MEAAPCRPALGPEVLPPAAGPGGDELASAVWWPPPRFALIGTAGVVELEKRRPVELLLVGLGAPCCNVTTKRMGGSGDVRMPQGEKLDGMALNHFLAVD